MTKLFHRYAIFAILAILVLSVFGSAGPLVPSAFAGDCTTTSIVPADSSFSWSVTLPSCTSEDSSVSDVIVIIPVAPYQSIAVTPHNLNSGTRVTTIGSSNYGFTSPGNTAYVNGEPTGSPYANVSSYTAYGAATARASGNPSATSTAYSQYGGYTPPGQTATVSDSSGRVLSGY